MIIFFFFNKKQEPPAEEESSKAWPEGEYKLLFERTWHSGSFTYILTYSPSPIPPVPGTLCPQSLCISFAWDRKPLAVSSFLKEVVGSLFTYQLLSEPALEAPSKIYKPNIHMHRYTHTYTRSHTHTASYHCYLLTVSSSLIAI